MCKEKRPAHSLCTSCNKWLCSTCTEEHRHGKETGDRFLSVSLKGCTGTEDALECLYSISYQLLTWKWSICRLCARDTDLCRNETYSVNERSFGFSVALSVWTCHSQPSMLFEKFGYLCFMETVCSTYFFSLWNAGLGFGGLPGQLASTLQYFCLVWVISLGKLP